MRQQQRHGQRRPRHGQVIGADGEPAVVVLVDREPNRDSSEVGKDPLVHEVLGIGEHHTVTRRHECRQGCEQPSLRAGSDDGRAAGGIHATPEELLSRGAIRARSRLLPR